MKNYLKALLFFFLASVTLVSCSDDDDPKVAANEFTLDGTKYAITSTPTWIEGSHGGSDYIKFSITVAGDDFPTEIKIYPQSGSNPLEGTYSYNPEGALGTYLLRVAKNTQGFAGSDWTMDFSGSDGGSSLVIKLVNKDTGIYDLEVSSYTLSAGGYNASFEFVEESKIAFTFHYQGSIIAPL